MKFRLVVNAATATGDIPGDYFFRHSDTRINMSGAGHAGIKTADGPLDIDSFEVIGF